MKEENKQEVTNHIAKEARIELDNKMYYDPIHQTQMEGNFYRELLRSNKHPLWKAAFSILFLILPSLIALTVFTIKLLFSPSVADKFSLLYVYLLIGLFLFIGIKMLLSTLPHRKQKQR